MSAKHVFSATTSAKCIESCFKSFRALITVIASLKDPKYEDRVQWAITLLDSIMIEDELIRVVFATMDTAAQPNLAPARSDEIRRHIKQVARRLPCPVELRVQEANRILLQTLFHIIILLRRT